MCFEELVCFGLLIKNIKKADGKIVMPFVLLREHLVNKWYNVKIKENKNSFRKRKEFLKLNYLIYLGMQEDKTDIDWYMCSSRTLKEIDKNNKMINVKKEQINKSLKIKEDENVIMRNIFELGYANKGQQLFDYLRSIIEND